MTAPDRSFDDLMTRLRAGDDDAAAEVFRRFTHRLIGLARSRLDHLIRGKLDPEDILQSVYRTFFRRHARDGFDLGSWDSLWGMLTVITVRNAITAGSISAPPAATSAVRSRRRPPPRRTTSTPWPATPRRPRLRG